MPDVITKSPTRTRLLWGVATIAIGAAILGATLARGQQAAPIRATLFLAPGGSDRAGCTQSAPCRSLDHAFRAARPGQLVELAGGAYPAQSITPDSSKDAGKPVVFAPAPRASVIVGAPTGGGNGPTGLDVTASHVTLRGLRIPYYSVSGDDVTLQGIRGESWTITGSDVRVLGGNYGPYSPPCSGSAPEHDNPTIGPGDSGVPRRVVIRAVVFHDMTASGCPGAHMDCLQVAGADHLLIDSNKLINCYSNDLILTGDFGSMSSITVQNNWFGPSLAGERELNWNGTKSCPNAVVRYNTIIGVGMRFGCDSAGSARVYANIVPRIDSFECGQSAIAVPQDYEVAAVGSAAHDCGSHSRVARLRLVSSPPDGAPWSTFDYHLAAGSGAIGAGDPTAYPHLDIDGNTRPQGARPDAGADERLLPKSH